MNEVVKFLSENPVQYLATVGRDGKAKCRPFMFCFEREGKLWFCTNNTKEVYQDIQKNPYIEISVSNADFAWLRLIFVVFYLADAHAVIADFSGEPPREFNL